MVSEIDNGHVPRVAGGSKASPLVPTHYQLFVIVGLVCVAAIAWIYLIIEAGRMSGSDMAGMVKLQARDGTGLILLFLMWTVMMVAMMLPSALSMVLFQATLLRKIRTGQSYVASISAFVGGYIAVWTLFSVVATAAQAYLEHLALLSPLMVSNSPKLGGLVLLMAGVYQMTPIKDVCLKHCRTPLAFVLTYWRPGVVGALRMGLHHGLFCVGCCWALMLLLFVGGVMNLLWVAAITTFVLIEKFAPFGPAVGNGLGMVLVVAGAYVLTSGFLV